MDVNFYWVDVFADQPLEGNPLALVPAADDLGTATMKAIAREFNQSETTFLVTPTKSGADYRLRSFTPDGSEVLGAGHNAMGAWIWLAASQKLTAGRTDFSQQIGDDVLPVRIDYDAGGSIQVAMVQSPPRYIRKVDGSKELAASLGLDADQLTARPSEVVSTGAEHLLVETVDRAAVDRIAPDPSRLKTLLAATGAEGCYVYTTEKTTDGADAYARFFNPTVGIAEDPATGTAAGPLAALLVRDNPRTGARHIRIIQGSALGRPSTLRVVVDGEGVELAGSGLIVAEGTLHL
jgi:trans-2,3-dihydro-3-hydroxyanthranilate isomerase